MNHNAPTNGVEQRAAALAHIQQMDADIAAKDAQIGQLKADVAHAHDRMALLNQDRAQLKHELKVYRNALIELATSMSNISLLTGKAVEIMQSANELLHRHDTDGGEDAPEKGDTK